jgi:hypothetical protein
LIAEQLQNERERLFKAMAIVNVCRLASESFIQHPEHLIPPDYDSALLAAHDLMDECAEQLELIGAALEKTRAAKSRRK